MDVYNLNARPHSFIWSNGKRMCAFTFPSVNQSIEDNFILQEQNCKPLQYKKHNQEIENTLEILEIPLSTTFLMLPSRTPARAHRNTDSHTHAFPQKHRCTHTHTFPQKHRLTHTHSHRNTDARTHIHTHSLSLSPPRTEVLQLCPSDLCGSRLPAPASSYFDADRSHHLLS